MALGRNRGMRKSRGDVEKVGGGGPITQLNYQDVARCICREVYLFLAENDILSEEQFGFRPGRSAEDQLLLT